MGKGLEGAESHDRLFQNTSGERQRQHHHKHHQDDQRHGDQQQQGGSGRFGADQQ